MPPTKREFMELVKDATPATPPVDPLVHSAKVKAELLTGDSRWDTFLQQLQATRDTDAKEAAYYLDVLKQAYGQNIVTCQVNIAIREARIALMDEIMSLPAKIVSAANGLKPSDL